MGFYAMDSYSIDGNGFLMGFFMVLTAMGTYGVDSNGFFMMLTAMGSYGVDRNGFFFGVDGNGLLMGNYGVDGNDFFLVLTAMVFFLH